MDKESYVSHARSLCVCCSTFADYAVWGGISNLNEVKVIACRFLRKFFEIDEATRRELFPFLEDTPDTNHTVDKYDNNYQDTFPSGVKIFKEDTK